MDRLEEWRLFASVATQRSFIKAAEAHGKSPQAVTRAVAALEQRLRMRLLNRTTRSVALTDEGARALERCRKVLADFDRLEAAEDAPRGTVTVTAPVLFGQLHVVPIVTEFLRREAEVSVRLLLVDRAVSFTDEGIDVGVRIGELPDSSLRARRVGQVRPVLCAAASYVKRNGAPKRPEDLQVHACIAFTGTTPLPERWSFTGSDGRVRTVPVRPRLTVNTGQAAIDAALNGVGVVQLLSYQADAYVKKGALELILERFTPPPRPVHLLQPPGAPGKAASAFVELASERLRSTLSS